MMQVHIIQTTIHWGKKHNSQVITMVITTLRGVLCIKSKTIWNIINNQTWCISTSINMSDIQTHCVAKLATQVPCRCFFSRSTLWQRLRWCQAQVVELRKKMVIIWHVRAIVRSIAAKNNIIWTGVKRWHRHGQKDCFKTLLSISLLEGDPNTHASRSNRMMERMITVMCCKRMIRLTQLRVCCKWFLSNKQTNK